MKALNSESQKNLPIGVHSAEKDYGTKMSNKP